MLMVCTECLGNVTSSCPHQEAFDILSSVEKDAALQSQLRHSKNDASNMCFSSKSILAGTTLEGMESCGTEVFVDTEVPLMTFDEVNAKYSATPTQLKMRAIGIPNKNGGFDGLGLASFCCR